MQLNTINARLALASCALLGLPDTASAADRAPWLIDSSVLLYSEADQRVQAVEPVINLSRDLGDEHVLNVRLTFDTLTGASPNGATPTNRVQTFTGPSGGGSSYQTPAGEQPLDSSFKDTRTALNASWSQPWGDSSKLSLGANVSSEFDFQSLGANASLSHDFNQHNTTLSGGLALEYDLIKPVGGTPLAGGLFALSSGEQENENENENEGGGQAGGATQSKKVVDLLLGVTQVISPRLVTQLNYSLGTSTGYHNDPYKILSVVDAGNGSTLGYVFERRPDSRLRQSLFAAAKYALGEDVLDASWRLYADDWGVLSHTLDVAYRWEFGGGRHYLQPHMRYYTQTAADFYRHSLVAGSDVDAAGTLRNGSNASADPRLAAFSATTFGLKYGYVPTRTHEISLRVEQYQQRGTDHPADAIGVQQQYDLFAETRALLVQLGWSFSW